jgi:hypothetical protein
MSSALPRKASDRVNTYGILLIGLVSSVLLWVSVVALQAYYNRTAGQLQGERDAAFKNRQVTDLKSAQVAELQDSKYVDPNKGRVTIPIDSAKGLVLRDLRDGAPSVVPAVGPHDKATVPAKWGRPPDQVAAPAGAAPGGAPAAGAGPAGAAAAGQPAGQPAAGQPAAGQSAGQPAAGQPAAGAAAAGGAPSGGAAPAGGAATLPPGTTPGTTPTPREPGEPTPAAGGGAGGGAAAGKGTSRTPAPSGKAAPASPPTAPATGNQ